MNKQKITLGGIVVAVILAIIFFTRQSPISPAKPTSLALGRLETGITAFNEFASGPKATGQLVFTSSSTLIANSPVARMAWTNNLGRTVYFSASDVLLITRGKATTTNGFSNGFDAATRQGYRVYIATSSSLTDTSVIPDSGAFSATTTSSKFLIAGAPIYDDAQSTSTSGFALGLPVNIFGSLGQVGFSASTTGYGTTSLDGVSSANIIGATNSLLEVKNGDTIQVVIRQRYGYPDCQSSTSWAGKTSAMNTQGQTCESATSTQSGVILDVFLGFTSKYPQAQYTNQ